MAINVDKLREGLEQYHDSSKRHLDLLKNDFEVLSNFYHQLAAEYEGQAADQFKASWDRTSTWFESYIELGQQLTKTLKERVEKLENV
ncbi:MAG: hypothetical protein ACFB2Y_00960 [Fulvivirga sp.]